MQSCAIILKQFLPPPGNRGMVMKTISARMRVNAAFKKPQLLPLLTGNFVTARGGIATFPSGVRWPNARAGRSQIASPVKPATSRQQDSAGSIWLPVERDTALEKLAFGLLVFAAAGCIAQAFGTMIELAPHWDSFSAWVARLLA
jgi:hypothetical protein